MKRHEKFFRGLSAFAFVLLIVITLSTLKVEASDAGVYPSKDLETGEYNSIHTVGNLQIRGTQYQKYQVVDLPTKMTCGEYSFTKGIYFKSAGNTNYYSIVSNVAKPCSVYIFATSPSEEPVEVVLRTVNEDRIAAKVVGNMNNNEVAKIELPISASGNYYIYTTGEAYILGVYFGGISDAEKVALGKQVSSNNTPYYLLVEQYQKEKRENVFGIALLVFMIAILVFLVVIRKNKGKEALSQVLRETPRKKVDNTVYKE